MLIVLVTFAMIDDERLLRQLADGRCVASPYGAPPPYSEALLPFHIVPPADTLFGPFALSSYEFTKVDLAIGTPIYKP